MLGFYYIGIKDKFDTRYGLSSNKLGYINIHIRILKNNRNMGIALLIISQSRIYNIRKLEMILILATETWVSHTRKYCATFSVKD